MITLKTYAGYINLSLSKDPLRPLSEYPKAVVDGPTNLREVIGNDSSDTEKYKILSVQFGEFKKVIHSTIVMEWVLNKSTEIQNYVNQVKKFHVDRLYWNFVKDPVRAQEDTDKNGDEYPKLRKDANGIIYQPSMPVVPRKPQPYMGPKITTTANPEYGSF